MHAEIISIGTELTTGAKLDTNSQWLSLELLAVGIPVHYHVTVADDIEANESVFRTAADRSDIVLITGGLGPTLDDLTRDVLARMTGTKLVLHEPSLEIIRGMFARRKRDMPERNIVQAMFPEGAEPIPNRRGTAPGIYMEIARNGRPPCRIAAMPGVPSEMKVMFQDDVLPRIKPSEAAGLVIRHARIHCFGLGESAAEELLGDVTARGRDPEVGITVHEATITLRIVSSAPTIAESLAKIEATKKVIYEKMGDYAFGEEDDELEHVVVRLLLERKETLAIREYATGGLLVHRVTDVPGYERCFRYAEVFTRNAVSANDERSLGRFTHEWKRSPTDPEVVIASPSPEKAAQFARTIAIGCARMTKVDWALVVTECSRYDDTETMQDAPFVYVAVADREAATAVQVNVAGDPTILKSRVAKSALNLLRLKLLK